MRFSPSRPQANSTRPTDVGAPHEVVRGTQGAERVFCTLSSGQFRPFRGGALEVYSWCTHGTPCHTRCKSVTCVSPNLRFSVRLNPSGASIGALSSQTITASDASQPPAAAAASACCPIPLP